MTTPSKPGAGGEWIRQQIDHQLIMNRRAAAFPKLEQQNAKLAEALRNVLKSDLAGAHSFAEEALAEHDQSKQ